METVNAPDDKDKGITRRRFLHAIAGGAGAAIIGAHRSEADQASFYRKLEALDATEAQKAELRTHYESMPIPLKRIVEDGITCHDESYVPFVVEWNGPTHFKIKCRKPPRS